MYKDIISYQLADNINEEHLIKVCKTILNNWMKEQKGFVNWELHKTKDGHFTDIVTWQSEEAAKLAEKNMANLPTAGDWFACYKEGSISTKNLWSISEL